MHYARSEAKQAARKDFTGIWAATTTPFTSDNRLDRDAIVSDMDHLTSSLRVGGVFCTGVMGEFWALTDEERKQASRRRSRRRPGHARSSRTPVTTRLARPSN